MSSKKNTHRVYSVGLGKPPQHTRFPKGKSANPKGRRPGPKTLQELFDWEMHRQRSAKVSGKRVKLTAKELMVRSLVEATVNGDKRALTELIDLLGTYGDGAGQTVPSVPFWDAMERNNWDRLTNQFFHDQDNAMRAWRKQIRDAMPMGLLLKRELDRKIEATRSGEAVKVRVRDAIVARFIKEATQGDVSILKILLTLVPEKKLPRCPLRDVVEPPTDAQREYFNTQLAKDAALIASLESELGKPLKR